MEAKVSIIILNLNGWDDTIECLESLYQINYSNYDIILLDNDSNDDSISKIKSYCEGKIEIKSPYFNYNPKNKPIKILEFENSDLENQKNVKIEKIYSENLILIKNNKNYGFAEGNNIGIRFVLNYLKSDYILLLNNDTVVDKNFLNEMIKDSSESDVGIIGSTIYFYDNPTRIQSTGFKINWYLGEIISLRNKDKDSKDNHFNQVSSVSGCSMMIKSDVLKKIGFIDNSYFLYYEDTDFCIRANNAGYKVIFTPYSKVWHKSSVTSTKITGLREFYSARNLFQFMRKYSNKKQYYFFLLYFFCFRIWFTSLIIIVYHKETSAFIPFLRGIYNGWKYMKV